LDPIITAPTASNNTFGAGRRPREKEVRHLFPRPSEGRNMTTDLRIQVVTEINKLHADNKLVYMTTGQIHSHLEHTIGKYVSYSGMRAMLAASATWKYRKRQPAAKKESPVADSALAAKVARLEARVAEIETALGMKPTA